MYCSMTLSNASLVSSADLNFFIFLYPFLFDPWCLSLYFFNGCLCNTPRQIRDWTKIISAIFTFLRVCVFLGDALNGLRVGEGDGQFMVVPDNITCLLPCLQLSGRQALFIRTEKHFQFGQREAGKKILLLLLLYYNC